MGNRKTTMGKRRNRTIEMTIAPTPWQETKSRHVYKSRDWIEKHIDDIAQWYQEHIWVVPVSVNVSGNAQLTVTASSGEFYSEMITDPDDDGNYPMIIKKKKYWMSARLVKFYAAS